MKVVILGGNATGLAAATKLKRIDKTIDVTIYEKSLEFSVGSCGLPYFVGGIISDSNQLVTGTKEHFQSLGINIVTNSQAVKVNPEAKEVSIKNATKTFTERYDKLIIATGASAILPNVKGNSLENIFTLKYIKDAENIKNAIKQNNFKHITIVGGGFIGLELAENLKHIGLEVLIIENRNRFMANVFDVEAHNFIHKTLVKNKVKIALEETVTEVLGEKKVEKIITTKDEYKTDCVIFCTGLKPNTEFLNDLNFDKLGNGALIINKKGETSIKDIYSGGDCSSIYNKVKKADDYIPLATTANKIGRIIAHNICGENVEFKGTLSSSALKIFDAEFSKIGINEEEAKKLNLDYKAIFIESSSVPSYYINHSPLDLKIVYSPKRNIILGAQIFGNCGAVLRGTALSVIIDQEVNINELGYLDFSYSPPFSKTWDIINLIGNLIK